MYYMLFVSFLLLQNFKKVWFVASGGVQTSSDNSEQDETIQANKCYYLDEDMVKRLNECLYKCEDYADQSTSEQIITAIEDDRIRDHHDAYVSYLTDSRKYELTSFLKAIVEFFVIKLNFNKNCQRISPTIVIAQKDRLELIKEIQTQLYSTFRHVYPVLKALYEANKLCQSEVDTPLGIPSEVTDWLEVNIPNYLKPIGAQEKLTFSAAQHVQKFYDENKDSAVVSEFARSNPWLMKCAIDQSFRKHIKKA